MKIIFNIKDIYSLVEREIDDIMKKDKEISITHKHSLSQMCELWFIHNLRSMHIVLFDDVGSLYKYMSIPTIHAINRVHWGLSSLLYRILKLHDSIYDRESSMVSLDRNKIVFKFK